MAVAQALAPTTQLTGGAALVRLLRAAGVRDIYGVPAGKLGGFLKAVGEEPALRHLGTRHEASAVWMASAIFQATGRLAVAYGESGPGSHNLVSGLGSAHANGLAVLVLTSAPPAHLADPLRGAVMEVDNARLFAGCTKWSGTVRDPRRLPELVHTALRHALTGRPGPVHLAVPAEVLSAVVEHDPRLLDADRSHVLPVSRSPADPLAITHAAQLLEAAERPLLIAGGGVALADAGEAFRALALHLGAAGTATQMGLGAVSTASPAFFGHGGIIGGEAVGRALAEADVVLAVGCRFSSWTWAGSAPFARGWPEQELIQVDVDPLAVGRARPVSVGIVADAAVALEQLLDAVRRGSADPAWLDGLVAEHRAARAALVPQDAGEPMHPAVLAEELGRALPADALVAYDGAHTSFWTNDLTPALAPRTRFHEPGMGHLGFGLPYAIALKAEFPDRAVVNVTGDGALGFTLPELDVARRAGIAAVTVVHDNQAWGVIALGQGKAGFELGTSLEGTDYVAIARAFGCHAESVARPGEVGPALERALASGLPAVIDARVRFEPHPQMGRFAAVGRREPGA